MRYLLLAFAAITVSSAAAADPAQSFAVLRGGIVWPQMSFENDVVGPDVELAVGRWFEPWKTQSGLSFGGELAVGWYRFEGDRSPIPGSTGTPHETVAVIPVTATAKLALPISGLRPYILGGGGVSWLDWKRTGSAGEGNDSDVFWTGHAGAGFLVPVFGSGLVTVEARYVFASAEALDTSQDMDALRLSVGLGIAF